MFVGNPTTAAAYDKFSPSKSIATAKCRRQEYSQVSAALQPEGGKVMVPVLGAKL